MSRKKKGKRIILRRNPAPDGLEGPLSGNLSDRASTAELVYNTLDRVAPEDVDGIKRAYVDISTDAVTIEAPTSAEEMETASLYGIEPTSVASLTEPFPLIKRNIGPPVFDIKNKEHRSMLRMALRRIVDEV